MNVPAAARSGTCEAAFGGILGQAGAVRLLTAALEGGRVPHAYLFHGPEGVGKATAARRLGAALLCTGSGPRPCGTCPACGRIGRGDAYDLLHIVPDGTWIKVDQVRALADLMRAGPERGVVIVDPADTLNDQAANALLKTLEEPPAGWTLVLVTSRPEALLATIRSRCQAVRFGRLDDGATRAVLCGGGVEPAHLERAVALAQGAPGTVLALGLDGDELAHEQAEVIGVLAPETLTSPSEIFAAAERWGRDPGTTRRFLTWTQLWVSEALRAVQGADAAVADTWGDWADAPSPARWARMFPAPVLAEFQLALQETEGFLERNVNRQSAIEALLVTLMEARQAGVAATAREGRG